MHIMQGFVPGRALCQIGWVVGVSKSFRVCLVLKLMAVHKASQEKTEQCMMDWISVF